jgi:hypothetical protein
VATSLTSLSFKSSWLLPSGLTLSGSGAVPSPQPQQASAAGFGIAGGCAGRIQEPIDVEQKINVEVRMRGRPFDRLRAGSAVRRNLHKDRAQARAPAVHKNLQPQAGVHVPHKF